MKKDKLLLIFSLALTLFSVSCDDFLDVVPDARPELTDAKKVGYLLNSAYGQHIPIVATECASDNKDWLDKAGISYYYLAQEEAFFWKDVRDEGGNDALVDFYPSYYSAIACANQALIAIEEQGTPESMLPYKGEALLTRAFHHFMLVNVYGQHYNKQTSETDLGIVYMDRAETTLNPYYERESVAEVYRKIDKDIEEGLPLIDDAIWQYPKYHFNKRASYAFAARFNLFYGNYDKAIKYATEAIGADAEPMLRKWSDYANIGTETDYVTRYYTSLDQNCNLMLITAVSSVQGYYSNNRKYQHTNQVSDLEAERGPGPWGPARGALSPRSFWMVITRLTDHNSVFWKNVPMAMKKSSPTATSGVNHTTWLPFTAEETLLVRAEAYVMKDDYENATKDLALWMKVMVRPNPGVTTNILTREMINNYYSTVPYYQWNAPTPKKHLHPLDFTLEEGSEKENFLQCVLHFRRIETINQGWRWYDIKRFGIEIYRRRMDDSNGYDSSTGMANKTSILEAVDSLKVGDPRRAMQLPPDVIAAGLEANPGVYRK
ncbi:MAG: RagB/SusD family nutrient uptake outer membrane protein [Dysgonamonadaceae bacterium]|jgi:tetratricopeptide (TPR) repeat protein|nr:RagB/SusD family nutrient uptake outer membrane protein [Dysgonamonadaceae bacterium]